MPQERPHFMGISDWSDKQLTAEMKVISKEVERRLVSPRWQEIEGRAIAWNREHDDPNDELGRVDNLKNV